MSGTRTVRRSRRSVVALAAAALTCLLLLPTGAFAQEETAAPVISNATVLPSGVPYTGGNVTITADVTDADNDIDLVWVEINGPVTNEAITMFPMGGSVYEGSYGVPPNFTPDQASYAFTIWATDSAGNSIDHFAGEVQQDGEPQFDEFPAVFDPSISPSTVSSAGGPVTLEVSATDLRGISEAYAVVTGGPVGGATVVPLEGISSSRFQGTFNVPVHTGGSATTYDVQFSALDDIGQQTTINGGQITVLARPPAPAAPLRLSSTLVEFGSVAVGKQAKRKVVLRNAGPAGTAPVGGLIVPPGPGPFSLGGGNDAVPFCLAAGQTKTFMVRFRPAVAADRRGRVKVLRTDGLQTGLGVTLTGTGIGSGRALSTPAAAERAPTACG